MRMVQCRVLKRSAPGLDRPPYPGELGQRIYEEVSREAWLQWLDQLSVLMNDHHLNTADPSALGDIEGMMRAFFFEGQAPALKAAGSKK